MEILGHRTYSAQACCIWRIVLRSQHHILVAGREIFSLTTRIEIFVSNSFREHRVSIKWVFSVLYLFDICFFFISISLESNSTSKMVFS